MKPLIFYFKRELKMIDYANRDWILTSKKDGLFCTVIKASVFLSLMMLVLFF